MKGVAGDWSCCFGCYMRREAEGLLVCGCAFAVEQPGRHEVMLAFCLIRNVCKDRDAIGGATGRQNESP